MNQQDEEDLADKLCNLSKEEWDKVVELMSQRFRSFAPKPLPSADQIDNYQGVYLIYDETGKNLLYVGETGNLKKRRGDLYRTVNHTFRRHFGNAKYGKRNQHIADSKSKYDEKTELDLTAAIGKLQAVFVPIGIGRTEIEEHIIAQEKDKGSDSQLYNIRKKRKG